MTKKQRKHVYFSKARLQFYKKQKFTHWTPQEEQFVRNNYQELTRKEIAKKLGRTPNAIKSKIDKMPDLFKSAEAISKTCSRRNKGMFAKEKKPLNRLWPGVITIRCSIKNNRSEYYIKTGNGRNYKPLHLYLYEQIYGKIPAGYLVCFKDGNPLNMLIKNLECITKAEHTRRNNKKKWVRLPDHFVASLMAKHHPQLRAAIMNDKNLIELKRNQLKLQTSINYAKTKNHRFAGTNAR